MITVYIKGNWFVIPLGVDVLGTKFPKYPSLVGESASTQNNCVRTHNEVLREMLCTHNNTASYFTLMSMPVRKSNSQHVSSNKSIVFFPMTRNFCFFCRHYCSSNLETGHCFLWRELGRRVPQLRRQGQERGGSTHHDWIKSKGNTG